MDVDGLNAAVLNPDSKLVNTEQRERQQGGRRCRLSPSLFFLSLRDWERSETAYHSFQSSDANVTPARVKLIPATKQHARWLSKPVSCDCHKWFVIGNLKAFWFFAKTDKAWPINGDEIHRKVKRQQERQACKLILLLCSHHNTFCCSSRLLCRAYQSWDQQTEISVFTRQNPLSPTEEDTCRKLAF